MIGIRMGSSSFNQQSNHGTMDELEANYDGTRGGVDHSISSSSSEISSSSIASSSESESESESDLMEEMTSPASSSSSSTPPLPSSASDQQATGPLHDMSSLMEQLPFKRGLSKHFQGKSQSFTSLANVRCLEDLAKPENPCNKRLKTCKSYAGLSESHRSSTHHLPRTSSSSRFISKRASSSSSSSSSSRGSCSSLTAKRPPLIPPHRSTSTSSISNQTPLFA